MIDVAFLILEIDDESLNEAIFQIIKNYPRNYVIPLLDLLL